MDGGQEGSTRRATSEVKESSKSNSHDNSNGLRKSRKQELDSMHAAHLVLASRDESESEEFGGDFEAAAADLSWATNQIEESESESESVRSNSNVNPRIRKIDDKDADWFSEIESEAEDDDSPTSVRESIEGEKLSKSEDRKESRSRKSKTSSDDQKNSTRSRMGGFHTERSFRRSKRTIEVDKKSEHRSSITDKDKSQREHRDSRPRSVSPRRRSKQHSSLDTSSLHENACASEPFSTPTKSLQPSNSRNSLDFLGSNKDGNGFDDEEAILGDPEKKSDGAHSERSLRRQKRTNQVDKKSEHRSSPTVQDKSEREDRHSRPRSASPRRRSKHSSLDTSSFHESAFGSEPAKPEQPSNSRNSLDFLGSNKDGDDFDDEEEIFDNSEKHSLGSKKESVNSERSLRRNRRTNRVDKKSEHRSSLTENVTNKVDKKSEHRSSLTENVKSQQEHRNSLHRNSSPRRRVKHPSGLDTSSFHEHSFSSEPFSAPGKSAQSSNSRNSLGFLDANRDGNCDDDDEEINEIRSCGDNLFRASTSKQGQFKLKGFLDNKNEESQFDDLESEEWLEIRTTSQFEHNDRDRQMPIPRLPAPRDNLAARKPRDRSSSAKQQVSSSLRSDGGNNVKGAGQQNASNDSRGKDGTVEFHRSRKSGRQRSRQVVVKR